MDNKEVIEMRIMITFFLVLWTTVTFDSYANTTALYPLPS